ncbi:MAG TPA: glycosyltransferase family 4 protein [Acidimicrobiales bacterium]|nr:glycosyltransferase family 4 protein [Acidimicrobiales bacterium]
MKIVVEGNLSSDGSYGIVNANLGRVLARRGHQVAFVGLDLGDHDLSTILRGPDYEGLRVSVGEPGWSPDVRIRQIWPPVWDRRRPEERLVVIQPWEFGSVPRSWIEGINNVDAVWVPSEYCKRGYIQSGIDLAKVWVVPNGCDVDSRVANSRTRRERTRLLFLGGAIFRKGIDVLVNALDQLGDATLNRLDLVVKEVGHDSYYRNQSLLEGSLSAHPRVRARTTVESRHLERAQLLDVIADADVLVHPYRAEGFAMPILEAMALGTPVIHTQGGASNEFCGPGESLLIPSALATSDSSNIGDLVLADQCYWLEPSVEQLSDLIARFVDGHTDVESLVRAARSRAASLSWDHVGETAYRALEQLLDEGSPADSLSQLATDLALQLEALTPRPAPLLSRLVAIGDFTTARQLATICEEKVDASVGAELVRVRGLLASITRTAPDVWSAGPYRRLLGEASFEKAGRVAPERRSADGEQSTFTRPPRSLVEHEMF